MEHNKLGVPVCHTKKLSNHCGFAVESKDDENKDDLQGGKPVECAAVEKGVDVILPIPWWLLLERFDRFLISPVKGHNLVRGGSFWISLSAVV